MAISPVNLPSHELISLKVRVSGSPDPTTRGLGGIVKDETRNTLRVESRGRLLTLPKIGSSFTFDLPEGQSALVEGSTLRFRPEDRVRRGLIKW